MDSDWPEDRGLFGLGSHDGKNPAAPEDRGLFGLSPQANLHDERNLAALEDPALIERIRRANAALEVERPRGQPAALGAEAQRALSGAVTRLHANQVGLRYSCELIHLLEANARQMLAGGRPHGFPEAGPGEDNISRLAARAGEVGQSLDDLAASLEIAIRELALARRCCEAALQSVQNDPPL